MNERDLISKGFLQQPDGSWAKRPVPVAELPSPERKPDSPQALDGGSSICETSPCRVVISIIGFRHKMLDDDNFAAGAKALRDTIACGLNCDDADPRLHWEYGQVKTSGPQGTLVLISTNEKPRF